MTVYEQAFRETTEWLNNDSQGAQPQPDVNMHELAIEEWWRGHRDAVEVFVKEESSWQFIEDLIVFILKAAVLFGILGIAHWIHDPYVMVASGIACLYILWKYWD